MVLPVGTVKIFDDSYSKTDELDTDFYFYNKMNEIGWTKR